MRLSAALGVPAICAAGITAIGSEGVAANLDDIYVPPPVVDEIGGRRAVDVDERSDFSVAEQVAAQYLVVTVQITKTSLTPVDASLVRGPAKPVNSAIKDLRVVARAGVRVVADYSIPDPRFEQRGEAANGRAGHWIERPMATRLIFVPLSSLIDRVEVTPMPGRADTVSSGGDFDPRPWATLACTGQDPVLYSSCADVLGLGVVIP